MSLNTRNKALLLCLMVFQMMLIAAELKGQRPDAFNTHLAHSPKPGDRLSEVRKVYNSQIGVREMQVNAGPEVEKYLHYVNLPKGNPWCAAFVCWVYGQANVPNPRSGWSPSLFPASRVIWEQEAKIKEQGLPQNALDLSPSRLKSTVIASIARQKSQKSGLSQKTLDVYPSSLATDNRQPAAGDIFALYFPEKGRIAHVGFIDEWKEPWLTTIEGNTNLLGSSEGDGVYRKRRLTRSIYQVARYIE